MSDREGDPPAEPEPARHENDRLDSWKALAAYLDRGVTTVQRWEQEEQLPVHRLPHAKKGSVFAFKSELDAWREARVQAAFPRPKAGPDGKTAIFAGPSGWKRAGSRWTVLLGAVAFIAFSLATLALTRAWWRESAAPGAVPATAMAPRPLANDVRGESYPSLSPDGDEVVYRWAREGAQGLYVKSITEGSSPRPLLTNEDTVLDGPGYAKWSPKGDLIAFLQQEDPRDRNSRTLFVISPSGGTPRRLTTASGIGLAWEPDGKGIAFVDRTGASEPESIYVISLATGERRRMTSPPAGSYGDLFCAFSPDGGRMAVARWETNYEADVYVTGIVDGRGEGFQRLTHDGLPIEGLEWTPDGRSIVFGSPLGLWRVPATAGEPQPRMLVASAEATARQPAFSRATTGGRARLAYEYELRDVNIWRWNAALTGPAAFSKVAGSTRWDTHPAPSPDGRRVAFASNRTGVNEIWIANVDGSAVRQVTFHGGAQVVAPQWSPDGERLAFSASVGGNRDIYVIRADGSRSSRLTYEPSAEANPSWSRDGHWIYFRSDRAGVGQIWKAAAEGGQAVPVTKGQAAQAFESPDGTILYFVRSMDVPGVWAVPVAGGTETFVVADVREANWGVANDGIYFLAPPPAPTTKGPAIRAYSFTSKSVSTVETLPPDGTRSLWGFSVSADGRTVLWCRMDNSVRDLMLIDPWTP